MYGYLEKTIRKINKEQKALKLRNIMYIYVKSILNQNKNEIFNINVDYDFNIYILRKSYFKDVINLNEKESFLDKTKHDFYNYVINFPNTYYFEYDRKILNELENQITDDIVKAVRITEKEHSQKYGISIILDVIAYILLFNSLIKGKKWTAFFYGVIISAIDKIFLIIIEYYNNISYSYLQETINKHYLSYGYFIVLKYPVFQIFKLKDGYIDKTLNIEDQYKIVNKDIGNLNEKVIENINNFIYNKIK